MGMELMSYRNLENSTQDNFVKISVLSSINATLFPSLNKSQRVNQGWEKWKINSLGKADMRRRKWVSVPIFKVTSSA